MGRHKKIIMTDDGVDRRKNGYYSTPKFVADFITREMIALNPLGQDVLDPCLGKEELVGAFCQAGKKVDGFDIVDYSVHQDATFFHRDFLEFYKENRTGCFFKQPENLKYDYYIANPPYNCHESSYIRKNKKQLQSLFSKVGVANMYSMFVSAMINLAKSGSIIGIITNDSFLTSRMHKGLRDQILSNCRITHLLLCPVDLFWTQKADVRTCIIILVKEKVTLNYNVKMLNRPESAKDFQCLLESGDFQLENINNLVLGSHHDAKEFTVGCPVDVINLFKHQRLGNIYRCVTGISTGNDADYFRKKADDYFSVPFFKNPGTRRFYMEPDGFIPKDFLEIDKNVSNFMVRNKDLLFKAGIACSSMGIPFGACALPAGGTYGVNANIFCEEKDRYWLLAYLNSSLVTYFVRGVLLRTNMITSGYVSRIPIIPLSDEAKSKLAKLAEESVANKVKRKSYSPTIQKIDDILFGEAELSSGSVLIIKDFCQNIMRRT